MIKAGAADLAFGLDGNGDIAAVAAALPDGTLLLSGGETLEPLLAAGV